MKLTKIQYKKPEELMPIAWKTAKVSTYKNALHNREWLQMGKFTEKMWKVAHSLCNNLIDGQKTVQLTRLVLSLFKTLF